MVFTDWLQRSCRCCVLVRDCMVSTDWLQRYSWFCVIVPEIVVFTDWLQMSCRSRVILPKFLVSTDWLQSCSLGCVMGPACMIHRLTAEVLLELCDGAWNYSPPNDCRCAPGAVWWGLKLCYTGWLQRFSWGCVIFPEIMVFTDWL